MTISRAVALVAALVLCSATLRAQVNDDCANATVATLGSNPFDSTMALDSGINQAGATCGFVTQVFADLWFTFTPATTDSFTFEIVANGSGQYDSKMTLYETLGCPPRVMNIVDCDDDDGNGFFSRITAPLTMGTSYLVRVGSYSSSVVEVPAALDISIVPPPPPVPANDDCVNSSGAALGITPYNSISASDGSGLPLDPMVCDMGTFGDDQIYQDVWFTFSPPASDNYEIASINDGNAPFDSRIAIYDQSTCPDDPANVLACDDDAGPGLEALASQVTLLAGMSYLIRVGSYDFATFEEPAALRLSVSPPAPLPPANDDCANAAVALVGLNSLDLSSATNGSGLALDPFVCDMGSFGDEQIYRDVWYSFTPSMSAAYDLAAVNNGNSSFNSRLAIYDQSTCPDDPANVLACDDDSGVGTEAFLPAVALNSGSTYLIRLGAFGSMSPRGAAALSISTGVAPPSPPANDDCANAISLNAFGTYAFDTTGATTDGADLLGFCDIGVLGDEIVHDDVWFLYTAAVGGCTYVSTLGLAGSDTRIAVYASSGCPDDPGTVLACSDEEEQPLVPPYEAGLDVELVLGSTYLIRIGNYEAGAGVPGSFRLGAGPIAAASDGGTQPGAPGCGPPPSFDEFCTGDGGDQMGCTNCPCSNNAPPGSGGGCLNSAGDGLQLLPSGSTSVSLPPGDASDLRFGADGAPPGAFCLLNSGDNLAPANPANPCFGLGSGAQAIQFDGLRCAINATRRHGGRSADGNGEVGVTGSPWGGEGGPPVGLANSGSGFVAGQTRFFQVIQRDEPLAVCMRGLNTSQAVSVTFSP